MPFNLPKSPSPETVHQVKRTLVDTLGCGIGAFDSEPASIARRMASRVQGNPPARILGTAQERLRIWRSSRIRSCSATSTVTGTRGRETAARATSIPGVLALAGGRRMDGRAVIKAITAGYEVFCRLADEVPAKGWDQGMFAAMGAGPAAPA